MPWTPALAGRAALVTGAGGGIGRGIAARFAREGARVAVADIGLDAAKETVEAIRTDGGEARAIHVDVADEASVEECVRAAGEQVGPIEILVNVAGVWTGGSVTEMSVSDWDRVMAVNARGTFLCCRAVLPKMVERGGGNIVNIGSVAALKGTRRAGAYNPSKAAVVALTKNMALDYAAAGIRVNAICPGAVDATGMDDQVREFRGGFTEEYQRWVVALHPLGRLGNPDDMASAAVFLASEESSWVTGTAFVVDGGCMTGY